MIHRDGFILKKELMETESNCLVLILQQTK